MTMQILLAAVVGFAMMIAASVLADMLSEEIRSRLNHLPCALLLIARYRVRPELRDALHDREWRPELHHILNEANSPPVSRLFRGLSYAIGLIRAARQTSEIQSGRNSHNESFRKLVSTTNACNILGNLSTSAAHLVLTFLIALTTGFGMTSLLGISGHRGSLNNIFLGVLLTVVFCGVFGGLLALMMGPGLKNLGAGRLYRPPLTLWSTPELKPHHGLIISTSQSLLNWVSGDEGDKARGIPGVSFLGAGAGLAIGIFTERTLGQMTQLFVILGGIFAALVVLRLTLVEFMLWWYERRRFQTP